MSIGRDSRLYHFFHRHHVNESLCLRVASLTHRKTVLLFHLIVVECLEVEIVQFTHLVSLLCVFLLFLRRGVCSRLELKRQLVVLVHIVVVVDNDAFAYQLAIVIAALIAHSTRDFHGEQTPLHDTADQSVPSNRCRTRSAASGTGSDREETIFPWPAFLQDR